MWKIWVALGLAAVASVMSIVMGWINQARVAAILYRMLVAVFVSFCAGYGMCFLAQRYLAPRFLAQAAERGASGNETPADGSDASGEAAAEERAESFTPLTADDLTRVSPPEQ